VVLLKRLIAKALPEGMLCCWSECRLATVSPSWGSLCPSLFAEFSPYRDKHFHFRASIRQESERVSYVKGFLLLSQANVNTSIVRLSRACRSKPLE
jgi:hypothetical protein